MELSGYSDLVRLTRGGMSTVFQARQDSLDRKVAIKFLSAELLWDDKAKAFFDQESLVIARLNHPNIIKVIDRGINDKGRPYFVMEYIDGYDLAQARRERSLSINAKIQLVLQVCHGMSFAHRNGVVHRDIKPGNILIGEAGHVHILDFGIAWLQSSARPEAEEIVGTPDYMSPEQFSDPSAVSTLSDIYSLGAVMYELFCDRLPAQHLNDLAAPLASLPADLSELILQCLQTSPQARPTGAEEIAFRLVRILQGAHIKPADKEEARSAIGSAADKFLLLDVLKRSDFSAVYLFEDKVRKNLIVVKKRSRSHVGYSESSRLKTLRHEHIVKVLGTSKDSKAFIVVMEYLTGGSLQERLSRPYGLLKFLRLATEICTAMEFAHQNDIMHGDLRPSNILFDDDGHPKISDFGFEKHYLQNSSERDWYQPEHRGEMSVKRDIFSAGVIFHQLLTGELPQIRYTQFKPGKAFQKLDSELQEILENMINLQSINRLQSFAEVKEKLSRLVKTERGSIAERVGIRFSWRYFLLLIFLLNLIMLVVLYFFSPGFNRWIMGLLSGV